MKKMFFIALLASVITACHKNVSTSSVPEEIVTAFNQRYPDAQDVKWEYSRGLFEARFKQGDKSKEAFYRPEGDLVRVEE